MVNATRFVEAIAFVLFVVVAAAAPSILTPAPDNTVINRTVVTNKTTVVNKTVVLEPNLNASIDHNRRSVPRWRVPDGHVSYGSDSITIDADTWGHINGNSMHPLLSSGSVIASVDYVDQPLKRGYIIRYGDREAPIVHMIVGVYDDCVRTYGINNQAYDGCIDKGEILSIVVWSSGATVNN